MKRCEWAKNELSIKYHDEEWGVPLHSDRRLFEFLILEGAQAGLSWDTVLAKRENYRKAFCDFDAGSIASFDEERIEQLLLDAGIIRNRLKVNSAVRNAQAFLKVQEEFGSFDDYIWGFIDGKTIVNSHTSLADVAAETEMSVKISKDLKKRGFNFIGPTIVYAFMQATGMVNDHLTTCFRYEEVADELHR